MQIDCHAAPITTSDINYRTLVRPMYKLTFRQVTALEWRCCPGFLGDDCKEGE
ncbi:unnamed protein product [Oncorhynchus mykiss]|uniref:EMI domain-containing protein n=1 Tax=Oncorhynchus mykiss TaxID=8022 RepID=A0A060WSV0_ONCMY|nr:unnamed protein product [Oncorhynchus mykiss]